MSKKEKHLFPGSNTSQGFYSLFKYIISTDEAKRVFYIKGGPGTGKSSLMYKIAKVFLDKNYCVEFFHCSSDNESLDAIKIKELGIALIDGTAPHINDPVIPGAVDEILNLGVCLNEKELVKRKNDITEISSEIKYIFSRTFTYMNSAKIIHDDWSYHNKKALDITALNSLSDKLKNDIVKKSIGGLGKERHFFATAFTPNGIVSYINTLYKSDDNIYILKGGPGTGKTTLLNYLKNEILKNGYSLEVFHDPLIPSRIEHIIIPDLNVALLTSNEISNVKFTGTEIDLNNLLNQKYLNTVKHKIEEDKDTFYKLLNIGLDTLSNFKKVHDKLEGFYVENIDFKQVDVMAEEVINRLLQYEKDSLLVNK